MLILQKTKLFLVYYSCNDKMVKIFLDDIFDLHCSRNVGEIGFGTNIYSKKPIFLNSHINERAPGVHIGFGQHNQSSDIVGYNCHIHLDLITNGALLESSKGILDLNNIASYKPDQMFDVDETDIFSGMLNDVEPDDCCGILTQEGLRVFS